MTSCANSLCLDDFVELIPLTLEHWLDAHTNPETWADGWHLGAAEYAFSHRPVISNDFFSFDWGAAAYQRLAAEWIGCFYQCPECGDWGKDVGCDCEVEAELMDDVELLVDALQSNQTTIPEHILVRALEEDGFPIYREALASIIEPIIEEAQEALARMEDAGLGSDKLVAVNAALSIMHHSGNITSDYGEDVGLDWKLVERVRNKGLADTFGIEQVRDYIGKWTVS